MKAQRCPVCYGSGKFRDDGGDPKTCHGCDGRGWVAVPDDQAQGHEAYLRNMDDGKGKEEK